MTKKLINLLIIFSYCITSSGPAYPYPPASAKDSTLRPMAAANFDVGTTPPSDRLRQGPAYALPEKIIVNSRPLRMVPLTPELMLDKPDEFFTLQNSVAADLVWEKERDAIGIARGQKDGPIAFDPELNCSFAVMDENELPVAVTIFSKADKRKGYAYLETFAVLPDYQGTAVASWLLLHSFQEAKRRGFTYASWLTREELDDDEKQHPLQKHSARAVPYYERKVKAQRDEKYGKDGRIPPKEETMDVTALKWRVRPGKWHLGYRKDLADLSSLYADFQAKSLAADLSTDPQLKLSSAGTKAEPLLHFPKWLRERLEPELTRDSGKEAARFLLRDCGFAFIGLISDIPGRLRKRLRPVKYFNKIVICENAVSSMARVLKEVIPRYKSVSARSVETELLQVALYYGELELKIEQRGLNFDKLREKILKIYGETRVRCPEFRAFLQGISRQYGYRSRNDTVLLRKLIVHFITEVVLFGNLPKVILDKSGRSDREKDISRDIVRACIKFIEETGLVSGEEIKTLRDLARKGGASRREKKKMLLSIFDFMPGKKVEENISRALEEDKQRKDRTSQYTIHDEQEATVIIESQQKGILAGIEIARLVFEMVDSQLEVKTLSLDGDEIKKGTPLLLVTGNARKIMGAERVAINYLQRLSGIATMTARFVKPAAGTNAKILDTRKTTPGMRPFEKYAVRVGGGKNHRMDLEEMLMIKDTHLDLIRQELGKDEGVITEAVKRARSEDKKIFIAVEVQSVREAKEALKNGVDRIMLDNMPCSDMEKVVRYIRRSAYYKLHGKPTIEASGKVKIRTVGRIARTGVDYISVGAITHSVPSLDIHLKVKGPAGIPAPKMKAFSADTSAGTAIAAAA